MKSCILNRLATYEATSTRLGCRLSRLPRRQLYDGDCRRHQSTNAEIRFGVTSHDISWVTNAALRTFLMGTSSRKPYGDLLWIGHRVCRWWCLTHDDARKQATWAEIGRKAVSSCRRCGGRSLRAGSRQRCVIGPFVTGQRISRPNLYDEKLYWPHMVVTYNKNSNGTKK